MQRSFIGYLLVALRGMAMGAADVVPGVSGGTIAFITGIYEEFINSLRSVNLKALKELKDHGIKGFWKYINGSFLVALFAGIGISIVTLAKGIGYLLDNHAILLWSFFFGLIIASAIMISGNIKKWNAGSIIALLAGAAIAYYITIATPAQTPKDLWFVFIAGMIAICAMILPGISGSFILLLLGKYAFILAAVSEMKFSVIGTFGAGCVAGLITFSHALSWMFRKFHDITMAVLTGFMVGSLNKVWPWKITLKWTINNDGEKVPLVQESVFPGEAFPAESQLVTAICMMLVGFVVIFALEYFSAKNKPTQ